MCECEPRCPRVTSRSEKDVEEVEWGSTLRRARTAAVTSPPRPPPRPLTRPCRTRLSRDGRRAARPACVASAPGDSRR
eukprot:5087938-Prymnesium_polylepis.1